MSTKLAHSRGRPGHAHTWASKLAEPSTREICLIGIDDRERPSVWHPGACISWGGRTYLIDSQDQRYVHLAIADDQLQE